MAKKNSRRTKKTGSRGTSRSKSSRGKLPVKSFAKAIQDFISANSGGQDVEDKKGTRPKRRGGL